MPKTRDISCTCDWISYALMRFRPSVNSVRPRYLITIDNESQLIPPIASTRWLEFGRDKRESSAIQAREQA